MTQAAPKRQRCAIYTRKSTEHNLDLAFNSLDAQREACEAYIKSQAHEGWTLVRDRFDDGGLSGASLERPALQNLLNCLRARQVDIVVVYKVDRLTRSLADFAKLVELFDEHDVSFVSVTQSFNTTSSMGRLTLNVLLSFAQFEREVIGERVRDKIAASKRKGLWVGGPVPLGYRSVGKKLQVAPDSAQLVRKIFTTYLEVGSIAALVAALDRDGVRQVCQKPNDDERSAKGKFGFGPLAYILKNRIYVGDIVYRGEAYRGEHEPILEPALFDAVQAKLAENAVERRSRRIRSPSLLLGKIFDDRGNAMSPSHANKKGVRYRYYVSQALLQGRKAEAGSITRVSAPDVEALVANAIRASGGAGDASSDRELIEKHLSMAIVRGDQITITLRQSDVEDASEGFDDAATLSIPFTPTLPLRKGIAHAPTTRSGIDDETRTGLLTAIAKSKKWVESILEGQANGFAAIAANEKLGERYIKLLAPLAFVSPRVVEAIAEGRAPADLTVTSLARNLPVSWAEQDRLLILD